MTMTTNIVTSCQASRLPTHLAGNFYDDPRSFPRTSLHLLAFSTTAIGCDKHLPGKRTVNEPVDISTLMPAATTQQRHLCLPPLPFASPLTDDNSEAERCAFMIAARIDGWSESCPRSDRCCGLPLLTINHLCSRARMIAALLKNVLAKTRPSDARRLAPWCHDRPLSVISTAAPP